eukprot:scaffold1509_cov110-Isochrysis_galbana.AAC.1
MWEWGKGSARRALASPRSEAAYTRTRGENITQVTARRQPRRGRGWKGGDGKDGGKDKLVVCCLFEANYFLADGGGNNHK